MLFFPVKVTEPNVAVTTPFKLTAALPAPCWPVITILPVLVVKVAPPLLAQTPLPVLVKPETVILPVKAVIGAVLDEYTP